MKPRNQTLDIAKGIGILLVIISHCALFNSIRLYLFSFHMPLFFIVSGYFFSDKPFRTFMRGNVRKLLVPYLITSAVIAVYLYGAGLREFPQLLVDYIYAHGGPHATKLLPTKTWIGATWFLMALFWCRIYFWLLRRAFDRLEYLLLASCAIAYLSIRLGHDYINLPFGLLTGGSALIFYALGYALRHHKLSPEILYGLIILWLCSIHFNFYGLDMVNFIYRYFPLNILTALGGSLIVLKVSQLLVATPFRHLNTALSFLGRNTLYIYCIHCVCIKVLKPYLMGEFNYFLANLAIPLVLIALYYAFRHIHHRHSLEGQ